MEAKRNRAEGWTHAKLSGHENEINIELSFSDSSFCAQFSKRLGIAQIKTVSVGGLCETTVPSVLGGNTKSKTDLSILLEDGKKINISIKKSDSGQVYLISVERFIQGYEKQFSITIPEDIKDTLRLYFHGHPDTSKLLESPSVTHLEKTSLIQYQVRKQRLVWTSLENFDKEKANNFLEWIKNNIKNIAEYCFSKGLARNQEDWADYVWYINTLGENQFDAIFAVSDIKYATEKNMSNVKSSKRNGGSTINLPFGFVQWHQRQMQFHHSLQALIDIGVKQY